MNQFFTPYQDYPIAFIAELTTLLPIAIGLFCLRSLHRDIKLLLVLFLLFFIRDVSSNVFASLSINNIFIYNFSSIVEISFLSLIFYLNTEIKTKIYYQIVILSGIVCSVISVFYYARNDFSVGNFTIVRIYGIFLSILFFERVLAEILVKDMLKYPMFWIGSGFLIYFSGTFFIFLLSNEVLSRYAERSVFKLYWDTNLLFYIVLCFLSSLGIWISKYGKDNLI